MCKSSLYLVSFKTSLWVMNNSYLLPLPIMAFFFINLSFMGLSYAIHESHVSIPHAHPCMGNWPTLQCPWEPCATPWSSTIDNTFFVGSFSKIFCVGFYGLIWCNIPSLLQLQKGLPLLHMQKGSKYTHPRPCSNYEMNLNNIVTFATHHHNL